MEEIVKRLWNRDESAIHTMEIEYGPLCRHVICGLLGNIQDVEETLNDVWLKIWNGIPPAKPKNFRAYLAKTARNTAIHVLEKNNAQKRTCEHALLDELAECIPDIHSEQAFEASMLRNSLNSFVKKLRREERSYFLLRYYFGQSVQEIAQRYQTSENQVSVSLFRIRERLRKALEKEGYAI